MLLLLAAAAGWSAVLFEVKSNDSKVIMEVSDDGVRFFNPQYVSITNEKDTLMVISATNIKALVRKASGSSSSRDFDIAEIGNLRDRTADNRLFKASEEGVKAFVGKEDNEGLARSFEVVSSASSKEVDKKKFSVGLTELPETINDSCMLWYPKDNAFRVGHVAIGNVEGQNYPVGQASFAAGSRCKASGLASSALGKLTSAAGENSTALGYGTQANGMHSVAMGYMTTANGTSSFVGGFNSQTVGDISFVFGEQCGASGRNSQAMGYGSHSHADFSTAFGKNASAFAKNSTAIGTQCSAEGDSSVALGSISAAMGNNSLSMGYNSNAEGHYASALGPFTYSQAYATLAVGHCNKIEGNANQWIPTDPLFVVGNGLDYYSRSNAFEVKKNGNTYIPSLYTTTGNGKYVMVDANGKLCVSNGSTSPETAPDIVQLQTENSDLKTRVAKLEALMEQLIKK